jgi:hypothetical protein
MSRVLNAMHLAALCAGVLAASTAVAQGKPYDAKALVAKYAGNPDYPALFKEPAVQAQMQKIVGPQMKQLMDHLSVAGDIELVGGALTVSGNAPHAGGIDEAIVCISPFGPVVEAAIASKGKVTVYSKDGNYEYLMRCVKDWITQYNSEHRDRMQQPKNVSLVKR